MDKRFNACGNLDILYIVNYLCNMNDNICCQNIWTDLRIKIFRGIKYISSQAGQGECGLSKSISLVMKKKKKIREIIIKIKI